MKYRCIEELQAAILKVGDKFIITDVDGKAVFIVADYDSKNIYLVRKWLLKGERPLISKDFNAFDWLDQEYRESLPEDVQKDIEGSITLPSEMEVFGTNRYGEAEEGKPFEWFKNVLHRTAAVSKDEPYTDWWWTRTKLASASYFAVVYNTGDANGNAPSTSDIALRPHFIIKRNL